MKIARTKKQSVDKRSEIIESARHLFALTSPEDLVLDHVAKQAGVAKGTLYLYFKDKSDLIRGVIEDTMQKAETEIDSATANISDPVEKLKIRLLIFLRFADENHEFFFRYCNPHLMEEAKTSSCPPSGLMNAINKIQELIKQVSDQYSLNIPNTRLVALFFMSLGRSALLEKALFKGDWSLESRFDDIFKLFAGGIGLSIKKLKIILISFGICLIGLNLNAQTNSQQKVSPLPSGKKLNANKPTPVPIPVDSFDLKTCFELSLLRSETIGMSEADIRVAEARFWQAVGEALPKIKVTGNQYFFGNNNSGGGDVIPFGGANSPGFSTGSSSDQSRDAKVNVRIPLFSGLTDFYGGRSRDAERKASKFTKAREVQKLYLDTSEAFYQVISYQDDLRLLQSIQKSLEDRIKDQDRRVKLGKSRVSELLAAQTDLAETKVAIEKTKGLLGASKELLSFFIGIPADKIILNDATPNPMTKDIEDYLKLVGERPDVLAAVQNERATRDAIRAQQGQHYPQIRMEGDYFFYSEPDSQRQWTTYITVDVPIFEGGIIEAKVNERKAIYHKTKLDFSKIKREAIKEVRTEFNNFNSSIAELLRLQEAENTAIQNYQAQQGDYDLGIVTNLDVLQSFRQLVETQRRMVVANINTKLNLIRLNVAAGDVSK
ncbi:MAG: TolC family protein [Verrucomicrobiota bacterium]|nr:TolC family protein [Verrucomicrobiota bacterium]